MSSLPTPHDWACAFVQHNLDQALTQLENSDRQDCAQRVVDRWQYLHDKVYHTCPPQPESLKGGPRVKR